MIASARAIPARLTNNEFAEMLLFPGASMFKILCCIVGEIVPVKELSAQPDLYL